MTTKYVYRGFLHALGTLLYVSFVAGIMFNGERIFGREDTFFIPVFMLLLFIVSALVTGTLVLGKPIQLYFEGAQKEAMILLFSILGWLVLFLCLILTGVYFW